MHYFESMTVRMTLFIHRAVSQWVSFFAFPTGQAPSSHSRSQFLAKLKKHVPCYVWSDSNGLSEATISSVCHDMFVNLHLRLKFSPDMCPAACEILQLCDVSTMITELIPFSVPVSTVLL